MNEGKFLMKQASTSALHALALHLEAVSETSRSRRGHGWTYDEEVEQLRLAVEELKELRLLVAYHVKPAQQPASPG
jgi:hypothetical protein